MKYFKREDYYVDRVYQPIQNKRRVRACNMSDRDAIFNLIINACNEDLYLRSAIKDLGLEEALDLIDWPYVNEHFSRDMCSIIINNINLVSKIIIELDRYAYRYTINEEEHECEIPK